MPETVARYQKLDEKENASLIVTKDQKKKSLWKSTNLRQKFFLIDLVFLEFVSSGCGAVSYAFFSRVVAKKGGTVFYSALILEMAMACFTIGSFVFGMWQHKIGSRRLFYCGLVATGAFQIAFGCLDFVNDIRIFTALGVIFKGLCGFGIAAYAVSAYTAIAAECPEHISQIIGFIYAAMGSARFVGPAFGGYMYDLVGMFPPIAIWGSIPIITLPIHYFLFKTELSTETKPETEKIEITEFLFKISTIPILTLLFTVSGVYAYTDVTLTVYFQSLGLSVTLAGLGTLCIGGSLALSGPIIGYLAGKISWVTQPFIIGGSIALAASLLIFSPRQMTAVVYIGCVLVGITGNMVKIPAFEGLLNSANGDRENTETDLALYSKVSGIWNGCSGAGLTLVPIVVSAIQTATKASVSTMLYSLTGMLLAITVIVVIAKILQKRMQDALVL